MKIYAYRLLALTFLINSILAIAAQLPSQQTNIINSEKIAAQLSPFLQKQGKEVYGAVKNGLPDHLQHLQAELAQAIILVAIQESINNNDTITYNKLLEMQKQFKNDNEIIVRLSFL